MTRLDCCVDLFKRVTMIHENQATAAVVPLAYQQRRYDRQNLCFRIHFQVLEDDEVMQALYQLQPLRTTHSPQDVTVGPYETYTHNISDGGLGLSGDLRDLTGRILEEGDFLKIEIHPPHGEAKIRCLGSVAWVELDEDAEIFRAGVSFVAVHTQDLPLKD